VVAALLAYDWPGNVRELKNLVTRMVLMSPEEELQLADLPPELRVPADARRKKRGALEEARREFERRFLVAKLDEHAGNISRTAKAIGLARESLSRKLRALKIQAPRGE
jgi:two-component system nitrogen regulation response regulator NtrX